MLHQAHKRDHLQGLLQHLQQGGGINDILWGHCKSMLGSMTISSTISPFVIDDNNLCSPCEHAPLFSSSLPLSSYFPLCHQCQRDSTYMHLKLLIIAHPINIHNPMICLYSWSNHPFSFDFILQPYEIKVSSGF